MRTWMWLVLLLVAPVAGVAVFAEDNSVAHWASAAPFSGARSHGSCTVLPDGRVLMVAGWNGGGLGDAQVYDPATDRWSPTGGLTTGGREETNTLLLPNGKVLLAGGGVGSTPLSTCEVYDPATGQWTRTGDLLEPVDTTCPPVLLPNGNALLAGQGPACQVYDVASGTWSYTGPLATYASDMVVLRTGKILAVDAQALGELYTPSTGTWAPTRAMAGVLRPYVRLALLRDGRALAVGESNDPNIPSCQLFDPVTEIWSTTGSMAQPRLYIRLAALRDGSVLVVGNAFASACESYDPESGTWSPAPSFSTARMDFGMARLQTGQVLIAGGKTAAGGGVVTTCDIFTPGATHCDAEMSNPTDGARLDSSAVTFHWTAGRGATQYWLYVGSTPGGSDLVNRDERQGLSDTAYDIPTDGSAVYVRLWSRTAAGWRYHDYAYTASRGGGSSPAEMTSPTNGCELASPTVAFAWTTGSDAAQYWLWVGTTSGGFDLCNRDEQQGLRDTVSNLPANGHGVYVRLWSLIGGLWQYRDYMYHAWGWRNDVEDVPSLARISSPSDGAQFASSTVRFIWTTGRDVTRYWLYVGTTPGGFDLVSRDEGQGTCDTVPVIPTDGRTIYVRLWSLRAGVWRYRDYTYTASNDGR